MIAIIFMISFSELVCINEVSENIEILVQFLSAARSWFVLTHIILKLIWARIARIETG